MFLARIAAALLLAAAAPQLPEVGQLPPVQPLTNLPGTVVPPPAAPSRLRWSVPIGAAPSAAPLIAGEHVYLARLPATVSAHHLEDGRELWRAELTPDQAMAADGELLFVAADEALHALRTADGTIAWHRPAGAMAAPLLAKDGWVIAASGSTLTAFRAADGTPLWTQDSGPQRERAAISGDTLYVPLADGRLEARDLTTGTLKWTRRLGGAPAEPLVIADRLFLGATDKTFYSVDADSGEVEWKIRVGATLRGKASTDGERVYFSALDNLVRAVDFGHGAIRWHTGVPFRPLLEPLTFGESVLVAGPVTDIHVLNARDGKPVATVSFPNKLAVPPAAVARDGMIVVAAATGDLAESWQLSVAALPLRPGPVRPDASAPASR